MPVRRSFQLANQAIDRSQNSESDVHPHQGNKHISFAISKLVIFISDRKIINANETADKRSSDASDNFWRSFWLLA